MNKLPSPIRVAGLEAGRALRGAGSIIAIVAVASVLTYLLAGRGGPAAGSAASPTPAAIAAVPVAGSVAPTTDPGSPPAPSASPSPEPIDSPAPTSAATATPARTPDATADPTPDPTPTPTKRPATPKPTHDPAPEPTPTVFRDSGKFGETLSAGGVTAYLEQRAPSDSLTCVSGDPDWQGYSEERSFVLRMTWSKPSEAMEPFVGAGRTPYFYVVSWEAGPFQGGVDNVVTVCARPGDPLRGFIEVDSNGGAPRSYRFTFVP